MGKLSYRASAENLQNELEVKEIIEQAWDCQLHHLPHLFSVDWYAERNDKLMAWIEFKQRKLTKSEGDSVWLNVAKKYKTLKALSETAPAIFVVRFDSGEIKYINLADIDSSKRVIGGEKNRIWADGSVKDDFEEMILIPISKMKTLERTK
jgi:hypothetical protein